jgi:arylsulfatase A
MAPYAFIENARVTKQPTEDCDFPIMIGREPVLTRRGPAVLGFEASEGLPNLVSKSVEHIESRAVADKVGDSSRPFFLYVPLASAYTPILPAEACQGKSQINPYADFVIQSEQTVGEILAALDLTGISQRTVLIFISGNGCSPQADLQMLAEHGHFPTGPFRGHKADLFEGGHRVPFIVRFPGRPPAASVSAQLLYLTDILATVAQAVVVEPLAEDLADHSFSFLGALSGDASASRRRDSLVSHSIIGSFAIRRGERNLLLCPGSGGWSTPRPVSPGSEILPKPQLFNLAEGVAESTNRHPDIAADLEG